MSAQHAWRASTGGSSICMLYMGVRHAACTSTVVVVQRSDPEPEAMMAELGFGRLSLVDNFPVAHSVQ